ncbi:MAG: BamA/TamA family outer membrane protein [Muribaculaceae bacterium]
MRKFIYIFFSLCAFAAFANNENVDSIINVPDIKIDTLSTQKGDQPSAVLSTDSVPVKKKRNVLQKFFDYFGDANKEKKNKKFDFNVIGGPHYSTDTEFGLGLVGAGLYRLDRNDSILPPSNVSLYGDISTVGFYLLGIRGTNIFPQDRYRLNYSVYFYSFPSYYWGIGYENGNNNDNVTKMKRFQSKIKGEFLFKVAKNLYVGPVLTWDYVRGDTIAKPELLNGMDLITRNYGFGATISYDSRDCLTNASKGCYIYINQMFRPKFLWNTYAYSTTDIHASYYRRVWKGGILAGELRGLFNFGNPSWAMMAKLGNSNSMRGYYEGRYRDKHMLEAQIELRQHVWRRNSVTVWVGAGSVFHNSDSFGHVLPNYGLGYRWEFKKNVNVRLDVGFGKPGQWGFIFQINEAF